MDKFELPCEKCGAIVIVEPCCGASEHSVRPICEKCGGSNYYRPCGRMMRMQEPKLDRKKKFRKDKRVEKRGLMNEKYEERSD